ncbi:jg7978 [Pararge aegeria aegeria]|uniref:Jg7978 protein n=1 Tax=Pararge aegeria aegeria TaxID=348720 RepID=A0A8S4S9A1_9NEOP|nr:jg7978 [Pararge aegeria aegeria]
MWPKMGRACLEDAYSLLFCKYRAGCKNQEIQNWKERPKAQQCEEVKKLQIILCEFWNIDNIRMKTLGCSLLALQSVAMLQAMVFHLPSNGTSAWSFNYYNKITIKNTESSYTPAQSVALAQYSLAQSTYRRYLLGAQQRLIVN